MFNFLNKKSVSHTALINSNTYQIEVKKGTTLLSSALEQGIKWPHRCKVGSCGTCKCKILSGSIKPQIDFGYVLEQSELDDGFVLACQSELKSDLVVDVSLIEQEELV